MARIFLLSALMRVQKGTGLTGYGFPLSVTAKQESFICSEFPGSSPAYQLLSFSMRSVSGARVLFLTQPAPGIYFQLGALKGRWEGVGTKRESKQTGIKEGRKRGRLRKERGWGRNRARGHLEPLPLQL